MMDTWDTIEYVCLSRIYALIPRKTDDAGWVWLKKIWRVVDYRPFVYLGLLESYTYFDKKPDISLFSHKNSNPPAGERRG